MKGRVRYPLGGPEESGRVGDGMDPMAACLLRLDDGEEWIIPVGVFDALTKIGVLNDKAELTPEAWSQVRAEMEAQGAREGVNFLRRIDAEAGIYSIKSSDD